MRAARKGVRGAAAIGPWREGNHFRLLDVSDQYFERMLAAIDDARSYVLLEMYLIESGVIASRFIEAFLRARNRGIAVCVLIDGFGSLGLSRPDRSRLLEAGVLLRVFNPVQLRRRLYNFLRNHRKLLLIDGRLGFVGGIGITDAFALSGQRGCPWRDLVVQISGPVIGDWYGAFARSWNSHGEPLALPAPAGADSIPSPVHLARGRVALSEAWYRSELASAVATRIASANRRAWIMSAYFVPSRRLRKALRGAARRAVDVRLLVPGPLTDHPWVRQAARRFYGKLLRNGVRIFEYQPRVLHGKMTICDDWVSVGSSNLDRWSFQWNLEANQEIADSGLADAAAEVFEGDCLDSQELDPRRWPQRARLDRLRERLAGTLDRWLQRWRQPRRR